MRKGVMWLIEAICIIWQWLSDGMCSYDDDEFIMCVIGKTLMIAVGVLLALLLAVQVCKILGL